MTERWERQLRDLRVEAPPDMWRRVQEGPRNDPPIALPPRHRRVVAGVVALAVFGAAGVFGWRAFNPTSSPVGSSSATPTPGSRIYTDPLGWTLTYPADWRVGLLSRTSDGLSSGVTFSNRAVLEQGPTQDLVALTITHPLTATPNPSGGSSSFPLSAREFKVAPGAANASTLPFRIEGVRYLASLRIGASASRADVTAMDRMIASIRPPGQPTTTSAVVRSDGRTLRCTATFPNVPLTPGEMTDARFSVQNVAGTAQQVRIGVNGDVGWLVFASDGTQLQDSSRTHDGIFGPAPSTHELRPGASQTIGTEDTAVLWPGPLLVTPYCMGSPLPSVTLPVASPGAPATSAALDQAVSAFGGKFSACRPQQSGVWVSGTIAGKAETTDARCAGLVIAHPGFDVVVIATVSPPGAPAVDLAQLMDMIEAVPTFSFPKDTSIRLSWWVTVVTSSGTSCNRAVAISISPDSSGYSGLECSGTGLPGA